MAEFKPKYNPGRQNTRDRLRHPMLLIERVPGVGKPLAARNAARLGREKIISVNALGGGAPAARCTFVAHPAEKKSDGFVLQFIDPTGMDVFAVDGGLSLGDTLNALLALRRDILKKAGLEKETGNRHYKLEVSLLVSHYHVDHVNELVSNIIPMRRFLQIRHVYSPSVTALCGSTECNQARNGDVTNRPRVLQAMRCYQPGFTEHCLPFGQTLDVKVRGGEMRLFAPDCDWGAPEKAALLIEQYMKNDSPSKESPVKAVNNNSMWIRLSCAGHSLLLTGDTTKRLTDRSDEAVDTMIARYGEQLRSDIVKYPHHGVKREGCAGPIEEHLLRRGPDACVVLTGTEGPEQGGRLLDERGIPWVDLNRGSVTFTLSREGIARS